MPSAESTQERSEVWELREKAARLIEEFGWTKGAYQRSGRLCLVGALSEASNRESWGRIYTEATRALRDELDGEWLATWNDKQKTRRPVLALLRGTLRA